VGKQGQKLILFEVRNVSFYEDDGEQVVSTCGKINILCLSVKDPHILQAADFLYFLDEFFFVEATLKQTANESDSVGK
jgi:hypothetical protein